MALRRCLPPVQKGGGGGRRRVRGLSHLRQCPPIAPLGVMMQLEVQAAQTPSVAVIISPSYWSSSFAWVEGVLQRRCPTEGRGIWEGAIVVVVVDGDNNDKGMGR